MGDLTYNVKDGTTTGATSRTGSSMANKLTSTNGNGALGKEDFLQLLVTQMRYQDPLNPQSDTAYVAQLATFSQLEQMQNLNATNTNSQAFNLVGKEVMMIAKDSTGQIGYVEGVVDFVSVINGQPYLSIGDNLYPTSQLDSVITKEYADKLKTAQQEAQSDKTKDTDTKDTDTKDTDAKDTDTKKA